jgi:uncharacterized membrane protein
MDTDLEKRQQTEVRKGRVLVVTPPEGVRSTVAIHSHPLHPIVVIFPVAFLVGALATDLAFWRTADPFWARASLWLIGGGLAMGLLAGVMGLIEFLTIRRVREHATGWIHAIGNATAMVLAAVNLFIRVGDQTGAVVPVGLIISAVTAAILGLTGWLGGELTFSFGIGVHGRGARHSRT